MFSIQFTNDMICGRNYSRVILKFTDTDYDITLNLDKDSIVYNSNTVNLYYCSGNNESGVNIEFDDKYMFIISFGDFGSIKYKIKKTAQIEDSLSQCLESWKKHV